jgi:hypothetical protein
MLVSPQMFPMRIVQIGLRAAAMARRFGRGNAGARKPGPDAGLPPWLWRYLFAKMNRAARLVSAARVCGRRREAASGETICSLAKESY